MPKADTTNTTTRRQTLAGSAVALLASLTPATASPHPDAGLLRLCARHRASEAAYRKMCDDLDGGRVFDEAAFKTLGTQSTALLRQIGETPALTQEGIKAKAWAIITDIDPDGWPDCGLAGDVAWSLLMDLTGGTV
jgi:hypothetical protein